MLTRRNFIRTGGIALIAPQQLVALQEQQGRRSWRDIIFSNHPVVPAPVRPNPGSWSNDTISAAWIGHATVLINFFGTMIITDPVFSERIGLNILGLFTLGPKRLVEPALTFAELPTVDLILLSHAHMDHTDLRSLAKFHSSIPIIMAKNTSDIISGLNKQRVQELDWGEKAELGGVMIEALRVNHFGWRYPWEHDRSRGYQEGRSFNGYLLTKGGKSVVFGGDTAYQENFRQLVQRGITVDLAIMPIGAYDPWIRVHANPEQALAMSGHMNAAAILPVHWNTFTLSSEPQHEPIERLKKALGPHSPRLVVEDIGETWTL